MGVALEERFSVAKMALFCIRPYTAGPVCCLQAGQKGKWMKRICVFCGARAGRSPVYADAARALAEALVARDLTLVFGGGSIGLMGVLADTVMAGGGRAIGVIPAQLDEMEVGHRGISELHVVESMHARKALMAELSDGFVALPGGLGTLEELFEVLTWTQLGLQHKPCGILDVADYFKGLTGFLDHAVNEQFLLNEHRGLVLTDDDPARLLDRLADAALPVADLKLGITDA